MMNRTLLHMPMMLLLAALLGACHRASDVPATAEPAGNPADGQSIAWFKGSVAQAFAAARAQGKPLFLYWGAVWCPPCEEVRNTVFKSKQFLALSRLFVPVYIDGDSPRAQEIGERFGVKGYPTMIVFDPAGEEITRIPGGIDISRYNTVLQSSLDRLRPTKQLLDIALHDPDKLQPADFLQLAYYSWEQDNTVLPKAPPDDLFKQLSALAGPHDKVAAARFYMQYLVEQSRKDAKEKPVPVAGAYGRLMDILDSDKLVLACWDTLAYYPEIAGMVTATEDEKGALEGKWRSRLMALRHDPSLVTAEQLAGWLPLLHFHFETASRPLPEDLTAALEQDIRAADHGTADPFARHAVVDQISWIYVQAKEFDKARKVLLAELDRSPAPWYFMSDLADLAEKEHRPDEAIEWYRRAYEESRGAATRFQWGASYVRSLIRLQPDKHELILTTAESLFDELKGPEDIFTGRNYRVLRSLERKLHGWEQPATRPALARRFTTHITRLCEKETTGTIARRNCEELLKGGAA